MCKEKSDKGKDYSFWINQRIRNKSKGEQKMTQNVGVKEINRHSGLECEKASFNNTHFYRSSAVYRNFAELVANRPEVIKEWYVDR